ncbi:disulfide isomerase DsbC N-terminal domain-containing protein [Paraburkholderia sp.]|uniref:disulfide isomerase DsbC N-terminal domain-containing protein n=1 Tax=Paraburkholderia sp. TaxID=1926495 RepID=UPI00345DFADF
MVGCSDGTDDGELKDILSKRIPSLEITAVTPSEINGLYKVVADNSHIFHSDEKWKFVIFGKMINAQNQENLPSRKLSEINQIYWSALGTLHNRSGMNDVYA